MSDICEITRIARDEVNNARLEKSCLDIINRIHKQKLVLDILKAADANLLDVSDTQQLQEKLKILSIQEYIILERNSETLLGLDSSKTIQFSYTERKALRLYLIKNVRKICTPVIDSVDRMQAESPRIFEPNYEQVEIFELEERRQKLLSELIEVKNRKSMLLKIITELKFGPYQRNALEVLRAEYELNKTKTNVLQGFILQHFCSQTQHTVKAIKEVERFIDAELEQ